MLGDIVNVVSNFTSNESNGHESFVDEIKSPALKITKLYLAQGLFTFGYIYSLSCLGKIRAFQAFCVVLFFNCLGERVASKMRSLLFSSIVRQDMAFFDNHRSGELVSRLTTDVQDFKSSFKMCISQGLRSLTQTVGCGIVLYSISPRLTLAMLVVIPSIISVGTLLGSMLRKLSKKAQAQVKHFV